MKIEKLEMNRVRVTLYAPDLIDMDINIKSLIPGSAKLHGFLYEIMERVRVETGFNPYRGQVVVEASPEADRIVLTVTRVSDAPRAPKKVRAVCRTKKITYRFETFEHVCELFSNSSPEIFSTGGLYEYSDCFYMILQKDAAPSICEFGTARAANQISESFLAEHGRLLAEGERLAAMAEGVRNLRQDHDGI